MKKFFDSIQIGRCEFQYFMVKNRPICINEIVTDHIRMYEFVVSIVQKLPIHAKEIVSSGSKQISMCEFVFSMNAT